MKFQLSTSKNMLVRPRKLMTLINQNRKLLNKVVGILKFCILFVFNKNRTNILLYMMKHEIIKKNDKIRPKKLNNMFLRHFFSEKDAGGRLFIFIFFTFSNKNDVPTMFRKNFRLLISGAESRERVHQNSTNQPTIFTSKQGNWRPD